MARKRILIIDDDVDFANTLGEELKLHEDYDTSAAYTGAEALEAVRNHNFDALLLDVELPDMNGRDVCRLIRRNGFSAPIVILTVKDSEADTVLGLNSGANDYVSKPFKLTVLLARLRSHIRQYELTDNVELVVGPYVFRPGQKVLIDEDNKKILLTNKEALILKNLYHAENYRLSRDALLYDVWGYSESSETHTVESHIYRLRQKIEQVPSKPRILLTDGRGYRLNR